MFQEILRNKINEEKIKQRLFFIALSFFSAKSTESFAAKGEHSTKKFVKVFVQFSLATLKEFNRTQMTGISGTDENPMESKNFSM